MSQRGFEIDLLAFAEQHTGLLTLAGSVVLGAARAAQGLLDKQKNRHEREREKWREERRDLLAKINDLENDKMHLATQLAQLSKLPVELFTPRVVADEGKT